MHSQKKKKKFSCTTEPKVYLIKEAFFFFFFHFILNCINFKYQKKKRLKIIFFYKTHSEDEKGVGEEKWECV